MRIGQRKLFFSVAAAASGSSRERYFRLCVRVDKMAKIAKTHEGKLPFSSYVSSLLPSLLKFHLPRLLPLPVASFVGTVSALRGPVRPLGASGAGHCPT